MKPNQRIAWACLPWLLLPLAPTSLWSAAKPAKDLRAGAAASEIASEDSMAIEGSILPRYVKGQEGSLRATALVLQSHTTVAVISVDAIGIPRDLADAAAREIESKLGIPFGNILICGTHTHSAPATHNVHGVRREPVFAANVRRAIVAATQAARDKLRLAELHFALGQESSVGQNSRMLLSDGTVYWVGPRDDAVRPTGPFDAQLPLLAFKGTDGKLISVVFNHSSHNIGSRTNKRSPAFYGLATQELESELGGTNLFLAGAFGSTHVLDLSTDEKVLRIKNAVKDAAAKTEKREVGRIRSVKNEFTYKIRKFDEKKEEQAVSYYCRKRGGSNAERTIAIFREMRQELAPHQGEARKTWVQVLVIGDIALVGVPGEMFTVLGMEIKRRSPFRYTYVVGQANDMVGYLPDPAAFEFGGYQTWMGLHSFTEKGTGPAIVDEAVRILQQFAPACVSGTGAPRRK